MLLNAVMCVWNEEDIIESTVKHLFAQGCSNVFIVDNASTDKTVDIAINAGAILADSFESKYFDDMQKISHLNAVVLNYNKHSNEDCIWWLYVDADEFPNIDCELHIIDFLKSLDSSVKAISGYMFDHIPTHPPYSIPGYHPADFMQLSTKTHTSKIPLLRHDKNKPPLYSAGGAHTFATCGEYMSTALEALNIHHFNYRIQENTLRRLKQLLMQNEDGTRRIDLLDNKAQLHKKNANSKSMYHERYNRTKLIYNESRYKLLMTDELIYSYNNITRWYNPHKLEITDNTLLNQGLHYFFLENYDLALFKLSDLLKIINDYRMQMLITIKIALCLSFTDKKEALFVLQPLLRCSDTEIRDYAEKQFVRINDDNVFSTKDSKQMTFSMQTYFR